MQSVPSPSATFTDAGLMLDMTQEQAELEPIHFQTAFDGSMEMYADLESVADYLQHHQGWFCRCAQPMKAEPMGEYGYVLTIGQFGALGFDVVPKMAVILEPPLEGRYWMHTVPLPDEPFLGYEVDYQAMMVLAEIPQSEAGEGMAKVFRKQGLEQLPETITKVSWELRMDVAVAFPKYIYKLPLSLIQRTGDRLLAEIIRQVSPRLTYKVQQDFHNRFDLPFPPKSSRTFYRVNVTENEEREETEV